MGRFFTVEQACQHSHILLHRDRTGSAIRTCHELQAAAALRLREVALLIPRFGPMNRGFNPDLQEVGRGVRSVVELGMLHPTACTHALQTTRNDR